MMALARPLCTLIGAGLLAASARAEIVPQPGPGDPHLQTVVYDPDQVVGLHIGAGFAVTVLFAPDERIETVTLGDSAGWQVQADRRADRLVVKSAGMPPPTDLTVLSDQRTYAFTLYAAAAGDGIQPYLVSFAYPAAPPAPPPAVAPARYRLHGARALWPLALSDDGRATTIRWPADAPIPAVYATDDGHAPVLANGAMRDGDFVIDAVHARLEFVLGRAHARAERVAPAP